MRARTSPQGNSSIVEVEGGITNSRPRCMVGGWRLMAANLALAVGFGLRLTGVDVLPSHGIQPPACQHADWLDDIIDTIFGGGGSGTTGPSGGGDGGGNGGGTKP